jgi:hypothetical protein
VKIYLGPHPEEQREAMRLEGWLRVHALRPSFETPGFAALCRAQDEVREFEPIGFMQSIHYSAA